ncbi:secretin N-terminal domain-containing protein [Kiritimatiellaeota bacterium B1221]|nr:secretin N-terminal domain-containing protein [Kiritimatiellaeota bacterium B1221]
MKNPPTPTLNALCKWVLCLTIIASLSAHAQIRDNGGARNSNTSSQSSSSSSSSYDSHTDIGSAIIEVDPETRSLIVVADEATGARIAQVLKDLDRPKPQVLIKVLFAEVTYGNGMELGVEGLLGFTSNDDNFNQGTFSTGLGQSDTLDEFSNDLAGGFWNLLGDDWELRIRALAETGKLEVLSRPSILARNNQEAVIIIGEEIPLVTNSQITDSGQTLNTIQYSDVGIILKVTPFINSNGTVEMIVAPEISSLADESITVSETVDSPVITKRSAETVVVTPDGETVVIGGLMETQRIESVKKVPILGSIPIVGALFRNTSTEETKKELLIFMTPYIVHTPGDLPVLSRREAKATSLINKSFTQEERNKYLGEPFIKKVESENEMEAKEEMPPSH